jgi:hypothetical protein
MIVYNQGETIYLQAYGGDAVDLEANEFKIYLYKDKTKAMVITKSECSKVEDDTNHYQATVWPYDSAQMEPGLWTVELWSVKPTATSLAPLVLIQAQQNAFRIEESVSRLASEQYKKS